MTQNAAPAPRRCHAILQSFPSEGLRCTARAWTWRQLPDGRIIEVCGTHGNVSTWRLKVVAT